MFKKLIVALEKIAKQLELWNNARITEERVIELMTHVVNQHHRQPYYLKYKNLEYKENKTKKEQEEFERLRKLLKNT